VAITPGRNRTNLSTVSAVVVSAPGSGVYRHVIGLKFTNLDAQSTPEVRIYRNIGGTSRRFDGSTVAVGSVWNPVDREHPVILTSTDELIANISAAVSAPPDCHAEYIDKQTAGGLSAEPTSAQFSALSQALSALSSYVSNLNSAHNALSNTVSAGGGGGGSVTSAEASAISAQAASAINVVSNAVSALSQAVSVLSQANSAAHASLETHASAASAAATSADAHAAAASAAATSVDSRVNALSQVVSALSDANSASHVSLEAHASAASAAATSVNSRVNSVNTALSALSVRSVGDVSTHGLQSVLNALSNRISAGGGTGSVTSNELSAAAADLSGKVNTVSNALSSLCAGLSAVSARSVGDVSTHGIQSIVNVLSNRISVASAAATSADGHANTVSAAVETLSAKVVSVSAQLVSIETHASTASAAATSVDGRVNSVNTALSALSVRSVGDVSTHGLQSVLNALSNRISAGGGTGSVTSNELSALGSVVSALSLIVSENSRTISDLRRVALRYDGTSATVQYRAAMLGTSADSTFVLMSSLNGGSMQASVVFGILNGASEVIVAGVVSAESVIMSIQTSGKPAGGGLYVGTNNLMSGLASSPQYSYRVGYKINDRKMLIAPSYGPDRAQWDPWFKKRVRWEGGTVTLAAGARVALATTSANSAIVQLSAGGAANADWVPAGFVTEGGTSATNVWLQTGGILSLTSAGVRSTLTSAASSFSPGIKYYIGSTTQSGRIAPIESAQGPTYYQVGYAVGPHELMIQIRPDYKDTASAVSNVSATSAGGGSATGLQAVINALSNKISSTGAGAGSVTSNELSAVQVSVTAVSNALSALCANLSAVSVRSVGGVSTHGLQSAFNALSNRISAGGGTASVTSTELSAAALDLRILAWVLGGE